MGKYFGTDGFRGEANIECYFNSFAFDKIRKKIIK